MDAPNLTLVGSSTPIEFPFHSHIMSFVVLTNQVRRSYVRCSSKGGVRLPFGDPYLILCLPDNFSLLVTSDRTSAQNAPILVWDTSTGKQVKSPQARRGFTTFLAFTPDGQMLWGAGEHGDLTAWDTHGWNLLAENIGGVTPVFNLHGFRFAGDGRHYLFFSDLLIGLYGLP